MEKDFIELRMQQQHDIVTELTVNNECGNFAILKLQQYEESGKSIGYNEWVFTKAQAQLLITTLQAIYKL